MLLRTREADVGLATGVNTREIARTSRHGVAPDRLRRAAEQGDRGPQRVPARVRHPPGRRAQGALDLRDHGRRRRSGVEDAQTRSCSASTPAATRCSRRCRSWATRSPATRSTRRSSASRRSRTRRRQVTALDLEALVTDELRDDAARLHARVVRRRGLHAPPAARHRLDHHARRRERPRRLHRRRPDRRDLPRHQRRHPARGAPARVPHRRRDRRPGRARRGGGDPRALGLHGRGQGVSTDIIEAAALAYVRALATSSARSSGGRGAARAAGSSSRSTP